MTASDFTGFPPEAMRFLGELKANNRRDWFEDHRRVYERAVRAPAETLAQSLAEALSRERGAAFTPKIFRIHRDVRFSKDKSPYNAHLHIAWFPQALVGGKGEVSGYYFGLEADRLQLGAGVFELGGAALDRFRAAAADETRGAELETALAVLTASGFRLEGPTLKRTPPPYPSDHPRAERLRCKGLIAWREITDRRLIEGPGLPAECMETFSALAPLHAWFMGTLD